MPIYEYSCRRCEHTFEALVDDGETAVCPKCEAENLERLLSLPARPTHAAPTKAACSADPSVPPCGPMCGRWTG
jgi:putative FmdB family regulatory protein